MSFHLVDSGDRDGRMSSHSAERQLWCAVIERALHDAMDQIATVSGPAERRTIRQEARDWFARNGGEFRAACEGAGYDPDYLRSHILSLIAGVPAGERRPPMAANAKNSQLSEVWA